jgi:GTP-binding protein YchF
MSLSIGIVGLPNVGKSTLFNALLKKQAALAANYPFATIKPNIGVVAVPDPRLEKLAEVVWQSEKLNQKPPLKPAIVEFVDIAGLVKGAHQGEGLGNQFLSHIREVDLICHVLRDFSDERIQREGSLEPVADRQVVETELLLADLATLEKQKQPKATQDKEELKRWEIITHFLKKASSGELIRTCINNDDYQQLANELNLLTAKKIIYLINVDENSLKNYQLIATQMAQQLWVSQEEVVVVSAKIESELGSLGKKDQQLYLQDLGVSQGGLERLISKAYQFLGLESFLTAGEKEVRAWTMAAGTTAVLAAGIIHSDFSKKFIKAKIINYQDFIKLGGWKAAKEAGKIRFEGRDYQMQEGDVVEFMIGQ